MKPTRTIAYGMRAGWLAVALASLCAVPGSAAAADPLQDLLSRTGQQVSSFLEVMSELNCSEHVTQVRLGDNGNVVEKEESTFDYLILLSSTGGEVTLAESRIAADKNKPAPKDKPALLLSNGFSTLFLIFHSYYSAGFDFSLAGTEALSGRIFTKIHFDHIPGTRSPAALAVRGREYPLDLSGTAWVDPETGVIGKIETTLGSKMEDVGLRTLQSEIDYAPISFQDASQIYWLPAQVTVEVESHHQHWRNTHVFTGYKRFSVGTKEQIAHP